MGRVLDELSDWLYKGKVPEEVVESVTVLLPKVYEPDKRSDTHPMSGTNRFNLFDMRLLRLLLSRGK